MSKKDVSSIVSGAGLLTSIFSALVEEVRYRGGTDEDIHRLSRPDGRAVIGQMADLVIVKTHTIDCDANPFVPNNLRVVEHQKGGQLQWEADKVSLHLCDEQKAGSIEGNKLRKKLKGEPVLNACVLDFLLANPQLIPEDWKGKYIFFWGTIYRSSVGSLYVRYLRWHGERWDWSCSWLGVGFDDGSPAALLRK